MSAAKESSGGIAKTVVVNLIVFFVLANVLYWAIAIFGSIAAVVKESSIFQRRAVLPNYTGDQTAWINTHWQEVARRAAVYRSYIGWRREPAIGTTVHVEGPYLQRRTINVGQEGAKKAYFFGGSTMWGVGANDAGTIPSQFAALTNVHAENFAESGYIAHQSLVLLLQLLQAGHRPDLVVFLDGVNEVQAKCNTWATAWSHERELQFETVLRRSSRPDSLSHYFAPILAVAGKVARELTPGSDRAEHDCHRNPAKVEAIAENLMRDWQFAKKLVEWHGGTFVGALQPVAYFSRTKLDHIRLSKATELQYDSVYPLMRQKVAQSGGEFHDLVDAMDVDEYAYVDWCHLSPNGNRHLVRRIADVAARLGFKP